MISSQLAQIQIEILNAVMMIGVLPEICRGLKFALEFTDAL